MMREYTMNETAAKALFKDKLKYRIPIMFVLLMSGLFAIDYVSDGFLFGDKMVLIPTSIFAVVAAVLGWKNGIKKGVAIIMQQSYIITDDYIEKQSHDKQPVRMDFYNVDSFKKHENGLLLKTGQEIMLIPKLLEKYDELAQILIERLKSNNIKEVEQTI